MISLDTETTGCDFFHGAKPFLVTTCDDDGQQRYWQWDVDPLTREPCVPVEDVEEIQALLDAVDLIVLQNAKFDAHALATIGVALPWGKVRDTLLSGHLLATNHPHELTAMCVEYLGHDIEPYEIEVKRIVEQCRKIARWEFPDWKLAKEGDPDMPSVKGGSKRDEDKPWKNDMWLPRAILAAWDAAGQPWDDDPAVRGWLTATEQYANTDSAVTLPLWRVHENLIRQRGLEAIYAARLKLLPIAFEMEDRGVTISRAKTDELIAEYTEAVDYAKAECLAVAEQYGHELEMPNGAAPNDSLREMFYGSTRLECPTCGNVQRVKEWATGPLDGHVHYCAKCEKRKRNPQHVICKVRRNQCMAAERVYNDKSRSGGPTLDKDAMAHYQATMEPGPALDFVNSLTGMRSRQTAVTYMESYKRFWLPVEELYATDTGRSSNLAASPTGVHVEGPQGSQVLDMDGGAVSGFGVWPVPQVGGGTSAPSQLPTVQRADPSGPASSAQVRYPGVCESGVLVLRGLSKEYAGQDREGQRQGTGRGRAPIVESDGRNGQGDTTNLQRTWRTSRSAGDVVQEIQTQPPAHLWNSPRQPTQVRDVNWYRLHPNLNPVGTDTLRWSSSSPNSQNISKKESFNLRRCFGPMPGREWWSMDGKNLELRIPAYEAGETELIYVFDHPDDPPYYGSYHLVVFDALHPELFRQHGKKVKDLYESTYYQWIKNGNFACIYGAQRKKADQTYHLVGAYDKVRDRFPKIAQLSDRQKRLAEQRGYVETIPDATVDPQRGYPILASRTEDGRVSPTTPLNYHISGTAMQWTCMAMIRCQQQIKAWNTEGWDGFMTLQVHDELVFDAPAGSGPEPWKTNLAKMIRLKELMQEGGKGIGVPTPVSMEWHADSWATGMAI